MASTNQHPSDARVTYVEFAMTDTSYPFVAVSVADEGEMRLEEFIPRGEGSYAEFFSVQGIDPERVSRLANDHPSMEPTLIDEFDGGSLFEFEVTDSCPAVALGERGALPRKVESGDGEGTLGAEVPATEDPVAVVNHFLEAHPDARLVTKQKRSYDTPLFSGNHRRQVLEDQLTDCQLEVIELALESGFYEWPREVSGEALADELGIAASTFHQHLRSAEQKLVSISLGQV